MVVQINKGVVSMVFIAFQRIQRGGEVGKQRYDELIGHATEYSHLCGAHFVKGKCIN